MKNVLILIILVGVAYYLYNRDNPNAFSFNFGGSAPVLETPRGSSAHTFDAVSAQLQEDMNNLPNSLEGNTPHPAHAFDVKRRLRSQLNQHEEYQVLNRVCDVIIQAEAQRNALQQSSHAEQSRTTYRSPLEEVGPQKRSAQSDSSAQQNAIRQRMDSTWGEYRAKAASDVERLLGTLQGKTL